MSENVNEMTNCPNCHNHCPKDNLNCDRGREFFGLPTAGEHGGHSHGEESSQGRGNHHGGMGFGSESSERGRTGAQQANRGFGESESSDPTVQVLVKAAAVAEHKEQMIRIHGGDESNMFSALTTEEKDTLIALLNKQLEAWSRDHAAHHQR